MEEEISIFNKPLFKKVIRVGIFLFAYVAIGLVMHYVDPQPDHSSEVITDLVIFMIGMIWWLVFFAQFVLPVNRIHDRLRVVERLVSYLMGGHGPAIFIENGFTHASDGENKKKGPGVVWLDSASAAVLRTTSRFTRTIGPGVHFTRHDEYIAATADLHTLSQSVGPNDADEPFKNFDNEPEFKSLKEQLKITKSTQERSAVEALLKEWNDKIKATRERADSTRAMTRDGIPVSASISVNFRIKSTPGEGNTRFGFNPKSTEASIRDSMIREVNLDHPVWNTLPARMAVDIWREYLGKFRLIELFETNENHPDTIIQFINDMIKKRLTRPQVEILDEFGQVVLEKKEREQEYLRLLREKNTDAAENLLKKAESLEFIKLSEMGLEIKGITIKKLYFTPEIEEQLISQWTTRWLKNALKEREQVELDRKLSEATGQQEGLKDFALNASREIAQQTSLNPSHALEMLVHASFRSIQKNPGLMKRQNNQMRDLFEIYSWLRNLRGPSE